MSDNLQPPKGGEPQLPVERIRPPRPAQQEIPPRPASAGTPPQANAPKAGPNPMPKKGGFKAPNLGSLAATLASRKFLLAVVVPAIVLIGIVIAVAWFLSGGTQTPTPSQVSSYGNSGVSEFPTAEPQIVTTQPTEVPTPAVNWSQIGSVAPVEQSPLRLGVFRPEDTVLFFLVVVIVVALIANIVLDWREGGEGNEEFIEKIAVAVQSSCGLIFGLFAPVAVALTYKDGLWFFLAAMFFVFVLSATIWRGIKDATPLNVALILVAASLAIRGMTEFPVGFANATNGAVAQTWQGFYDLSSLLTLLVTLRFAAASLTLVVYLFIFLAIVVALIEALKRYATSEALVAFFVVVLAILVGNYLATAVVGLIQVDSQSKLVAIEIAKPILGWMAGVVIAILGSFVLKGKSFNLRGVTMKMAEVSGAQSIVNFVALVTTISISLNLLVR